MFRLALQKIGSKNDHNLNNREVHRIIGLIKLVVKRRKVDKIISGHDYKIMEILLSIVNQIRAFEECIRI